MDPSWRDRKEAHVAGLPGTTLYEVSAVAAVPVAVLLGLRCIAPRLRWGPAVQQALEWMVFIPAQLVVQLDLVSAPALILAAASGLSALWAFQQGPAWQQRGRSVQELRDALTLFRASLVVITCMAILAVDFHAFPRRFGKAETFGTGLMDAGVGMFILASAIPAGVRAGSRVSAPVTKTHNQLARVGVLLALGIGRAVSSHALDYQNHVGEYGVHWNFFLTLAVVRLVNATLGRRARSASAAAGLGAAVLAAHQWLLSGVGLIELAHSNGPRTNVLAANKEGLLSLPGYLGLNWLGVALGQLLYRLACEEDGEEREGVLQPWQGMEGQQGDRPPTAAADGVAGVVAAGTSGKAAVDVRGGRGPKALARLAMVDAGLWLACWAAAKLVQPVSRRACNLPYVLWMLALSMQGIGLFWAVGRWRPGQMPLLLQRINDSMLVVFLVANVLTGLVNLSCDTLVVGWWGTCAILLAYMAAVCSAASFWTLLIRLLHS